MTAIQNTPDRLNSLPAAPTPSIARGTLRWETLLTWAALLGVAVVAFIAFTQALTWRGTPFVGAMVTRTLTVDGTMPLGGYWQGLAAGLRRGDQIVAIAGQDVDTPQTLTAALQQHRVGDRVDVTVLRVARAAATDPNCAVDMGDYATCTVRVLLDELPDNDFVALFVIPFITGVVTLGIGAAVLALRGTQLSARLIAIVCALLALFCLGFFDLNTTYRLTPYWILGNTLLGAVIVCLSMVFPAKFVMLYRSPRLLYAPVAVGLVLALLGVWVYFSPLPANNLLGVQASVLVTLVGAVIGCVIWRQQRQRATTSLMRDQSSIVLIGFVLAVLPGFIWLGNLLAQTFIGRVIVPFNTSAVAPFFALPAFSMAYAGLQTRQIGADQRITQGITYLFLALGLVLGYFLLVLGATMATGQFVDPSNPLLIAFVTFVIAAAFVPLRTRLQNRIDKLYFRQRINYQNQVEQFARSLSALRELPGISAEYRTTLESTIAPAHTFIFLPNAQTGDYIAFGKPKPETDIRFSPQSALVTFLRHYDGLVYLDQHTPWADDLIAERARLQVLKPLVIAGFRGSSRLSGFAIIGEPMSGAGTYSYDEQRFIENLTNQMTVAVERAQVVDSLERRVRELDILSRVSQAVNFTGEFDQLLELISTQTLKLIDATHVYIALRDPAQNELYYAFFLENGERFEDKENTRWTIANDLISDVVRSGQPLRVPSFVKAMAERGARIVREDGALLSWMGVPLITGSRVLGVLAVGTVELNRTFVDDQVRLLSDVGALAATSLDKARLFAETNLRARQLAALNDISRKLVASELDLDNLLPLITESARDLLNAEAGALLLTTDDASGDLEYKVDIGAGVGEMLGKRVSTGKGFLGEVASSGRVMIVNDVAADVRWTDEFDTNKIKIKSVLVAPLVTQNRVIGVLEIANRLEGNFSRDDAELVTTFAGQAAVAIENARLFQMTDLQLQNRLEELETLERIDAEMNRSLDLPVVAEIALRFAMTNTGATAGVIGLVEGEPPMLHLVAKMGYGDDAPPGAQGNAWPLEGIVSRALKTRRAELTVDVSSDPLYVPSLRDGKSQITVPMLSGGDVNAMLVLESNQESALRLAMMPFVQRLAEHASIAIANAQLYEQLTRANDSKSEFVSFVAHELKNPLTSIKGYADVLITGAVGGLSDQQRNFIGTIRSNAERMNTLVSDLNDVTKLQTDNLRIEQEEWRFGDILEETLRPLQKLIDDKGQAITFEMAEKLPPVFVDRNRIIQVLTNLISNAHKYSPPDTGITIGAVVQPPQRDAKGQVTQPMLHVRVKDTGIGMAEDDLAKLFTPYFRSDNPAAREQPGTGLGLTITRGIIAQHGGSIWVESTLGSGTTFHFTVPLAGK
jgi:signal transduction histidine kinase